MTKNRPYIERSTDLDLIYPTNEYYNIYQVITYINYIDDDSTDKIIKYTARINRDFARNYNIDNLEDYNLETDTYVKILHLVGLVVHDILFYDKIKPTSQPTSEELLRDFLTQRELLGYVDEPCNCDVDECCYQCPDVEEPLHEVYNSTSDDKIKEGDVVQLKSWSPNMTVSKIYSDNFVDLVYHEHGEIKILRLHENVLKKVTELNEIPF